MHWWKRMAAVNGYVRAFSDLLGIRNDDRDNIVLAKCLYFN